jgi:hypothetical protein
VTIGPLRNVILIGLIAIMLIGSAGLAFAVKMQIIPLSPLELAMANLRATPLVGQTMRDNPPAEKAIHDALIEDFRDPVTPGVPPRAFYAVGALSRDFIRPMLAAADDAAVIAVMAARFALATQLRADDPQKCRDFAMNSVQRADQMSPAGQRLFNDFMVAMEAAYRSGRAASGKPQPMLAPQEMVQMLAIGGFTNDDLEALNRFASLPSRRACDIDLKIDGATQVIPVEKRAPFARFVLTH